MDNFVNIELTQVQMERYKLFMQYYSKIEQIIESGMLDIKGGRATVHFKNNGSIDKIEKVNFYSYR